MPGATRRLPGITRLIVIVGQGGDGPCRGDGSGAHVGAAFGAAAAISAAVAA